MTEAQLAAMRKEVVKELWGTLAAMKEATSRVWTLIERLEGLK